ncbi:MAG: DUF47 domain-containing protein [Clostridia bacterium]
MAKKKEVNYFEMMKNAMQHACEISDRLRELVAEFAAGETKEDLYSRLNEIHEIEHKGDEVHDEIIYELNRAFITPIDREDILMVAHDIDRITDDIENVAFRLWMFNITSLRPEMKEFVELIRKCCGKAAEILDEFENFKKSKVILGLIRQLYTFEHEGDTLYRTAVKNLFTHEKDLLEIQKWRELYHDMEVCFDTCKEMAQSVENAIVKNS